MKNKILQWVKTDRSFDAAKQLYIEFGSSNGFKRRLNMQPESTLKGFLFEELRQMAGISGELWNAMLAEKLQPEAEKTDLPVITEEQYQAFRNKIPENVKKSIRLRSEFPFLNDKSCPDELKILVSDMLTCHDTYVADHKKMFEVTNHEEMQEIAASVVENYIENKEIWDELNYFKEHGKILGKHKIFSQKDRVAEIKTMSTPDLIKLRENLESRKSRNASKVKEEPNHKNTAERMAAVETCEFELSIVNSILGLNAPKTV